MHVGLRYSRLLRAVAPQLQGSDGGANGWVHGYATDFHDFHDFHDGDGDDDDDDDDPVSFYIYIYTCIRSLLSLSLSLFVSPSCYYYLWSGDGWFYRLRGEGRCGDLPTVAGRFLAWNSHDIPTESDRGFIFLPLDPDKSKWGLLDAYEIWGI